MTARIAGFVSRAEAGLPAPRSVNRDVARGAVITLHYGGGGNAPAEHAGCVKMWRSWCLYHRGNGYVDIAYNFGFCDHGYVFAGRGWGIRSGANGTNAANYGSYAACWIGGSGSAPTRAALDAADWLINEHRRLGGGRGVKPHRAWKATACPGGHLVVHAERRNNQPIPQVVEPVEPGKPRKHTVVRGETLYGIARRYGVTVADLARANPQIRDITLIRIGDTIAVPAEPTTVPPPPKPAPKRHLGYDFPLPSGHWFGPESADPRNHSGYWPADRKHVQALLKALRSRGWAVRGWPFDGARYTGNVEALIRRYQADAGLKVDGRVGPATWRSIDTSPVR